jgi:hypothetical protein
MTSFMSALAEYCLGLKAGSFCRLRDAAAYRYQDIKNQEVGKNPRTPDFERRILGQLAVPFSEFELNGEALKFNCFQPSELCETAVPSPLAASNEKSSSDAPRLFSSLAARAAVIH